MSGESGDLQRPDGNRGFPARPAGGPARRAHAIGATSPWTAGSDAAWWREDSATTAGTSAPPWRAEPAVPPVPVASLTPATPGPLDAPKPVVTETPTDEIPAVTAITDEIPAVTAGTTDELPNVTDTDELPAVTNGSSGPGGSTPGRARQTYEAGHRADRARVSALSPAQPPQPAPAHSAQSEEAAGAAAKTADAEQPGAPMKAARRHRASGSDSRATATSATTTTDAPAGPAEAEPETSTEEAAAFWLPVEEVAHGGNAWTQHMRGGRAPGRGPLGNNRVTRPGKPRKQPRSPAVGLVSLVLLSLVAAFFAWVSVEPLWLAVGHGKAGSATVTRCTGDGVQQRCVGTFTAASGGFTTERVPLLGVENRQRAEGTQVAARMIDADARNAYVGSGADGLHLRWALGLSLVLLCGLCLVWGTGALRLPDPRSRRLSTIAALAAPMLVAVGFFAAAF
ncbi:hypothetical protein [Micromonospora sp. NPDC049679]|uniref:hypothetical protein n=1 Tax=Micromonospora sp. NPDC049679 TaxID=3155920 RepID=UPI0033FAA068